MRHQKVYSFIGSLATIYDWWLSFIGYKKSVEYFISQLPLDRKTPLRVLDAGCGTGLYSIAVLERFPESHVTSFDFNSKLVTRLKKKAYGKYNDQLKTFVADIQGNLKEINGEKFDFVITSGVLEYVRPEEVVANLSRFLLTNGIFLNSPLRNTLFGKIIAEIYACRPYSREENIHFFTTNGFTLFKTVKLPWYSLASFKEAHIFKKTLK